MKKKIDKRLNKTRDNKEQFNKVNKVQYRKHQ